MHSRHAVADQVAVRRVHPSDADALDSFYAALSAEARRARFLASGPGPNPSATRTFCTPDHQHDEGFVATMGGAVVGHLCLASVGPGSTELGVVVADEWQGQGIGRRLFEAAVEWARVHGVVKLVATAFADNTRVLRLLSSAASAPLVSWADSGVVEVLIPLAGPLPVTRSWPPYTTDAVESVGSLSPAPVSFRDVRGGLGSPLEVQLGQDRADVVLHRLVGQEDVHRDLLVRLSLGDEQQDLLLL